VPPGDLLLYEDAYRALSLAVNRGSAAERLGLYLDAEVRVAAPTR
jgi:S-adenosylmethionine hydrolase